MTGPFYPSPKDGGYVFRKCMYRLIQTCVHVSILFNIQNFFFWILVSLNWWESNDKMARAIALCEQKKNSRIGWEIEEKVSFISISVGKAGNLKSRQLNLTNCTNNNPMWFNPSPYYSSSRCLLSYGIDGTVVGRITETRLEREFRIYGDHFWQMTWHYRRGTRVSRLTETAWLHKYWFRHKLLRPEAALFSVHGCKICESVWTIPFVLHLAITRPIER